jgi:hypothetical protein
VKVLLVTANPDALTCLRSQPTLSGCLFVHYAHPLRALDNLAAIDPDVIVWNADDYPRHWKMARVFCPPRPASEPTALFLVTDKGLGEEEENKAQFLEIDDLVEDGFFGDSLLRILERRLPSRQPGLEMPVDNLVDAAAAPETSVAPSLPQDHPLALPEGPGQLLLVHPVIKQLMIGDIVTRGQAAIAVRFSDATDAARFSPGLIADNAAIRIEARNWLAIVRTLSVESDGLVRFLILQLDEKDR